MWAQALAGADPYTMTDIAPSLVGMELHTMVRIGGPEPGLTLFLKTLWAAPGIPPMPRLLDTFYRWGKVRHNVFTWWLGPNLFPSKSGRCHFNPTFL